MSTDIILIPLSLIFVLFFSGVRTAFRKSDQLRLELDKKNEMPGSGIISLFTQDPAVFMVSMTAGSFISIAIFVTSFYHAILPVMTGITDSLFLIVLTCIIFSSVVIIIFAEIIPSVFFEGAPNTYLKIFAVPSLFFFLIFYPVSKLLLSLQENLNGSNAQAYLNDESDIVKINYNNPVNNDHQDDIVHDVTGNDTTNIRIFRNLLDLSDLMVKEIMVPRTEIEAVPITGTVAQLKEIFINTRFARILVYKDTIDNIEGYFEVKDIFKNPEDIQSGLRKLVIVPETMMAGRLLKIFVAEKKNIAVVVDEFGGTSGMVTIEDLLEEIVGDIEDEHDTNDLVEKVRGDNELILSGRLEIDYLNEKYGLNLPETDDYATLAGMILFYNGSIPVNNDIIRIGDNMIIKIIKATSTRIELVRVKVIK